MILVRGYKEAGCGHFQQRFSRENFRAAVHKATGEVLFKGTLNVRIDRCIRVKEHFKIRGQEVGELEDFLFEICRINKFWAYRIRPFDPRTGSGGHGDDTLEIACSHMIPDVPTYEIELFRDQI